MSARVSKVQASLRDRATAARGQFEASGTTISEWALERGFNPRLVMEVLTGKRACVRGKSHQVAVALGIKDEAPVPGARRPEPYSPPQPSRPASYPDGMEPAR